MQRDRECLHVQHDRAFWRMTEHCQKVWTEGLNMPLEVMVPASQHYHPELVRPLQHKTARALFTDLDRKMKTHAITSHATYSIPDVLLPLPLLLLVTRIAYT